MNAQSDTVTINFDYPYNNRLELLRDRSRLARERFADPSMEFPANPFGGAIAAIAIEGYFGARKAVVLASAAMHGAAHFE